MTVQLRYFRTFIVFLLVTVLLRSPSSAGRMQDPFQNRQPDSLRNRLVPTEVNVRRPVLRVAEVARQLELVPPTAVRQEPRIARVMPDKEPDRWNDVTIVGRNRDAVLLALERGELEQAAQAQP